MFPMPRYRWDPAEEAGFHVLVPGLMGIGFLISLGVLAADVVGHLIPVAGRRRAAEVERRALGRAHDVLSLRSGEPPALGVVLRQPRRRVTALVLATIAALVATASVASGYTLAAHVGVDRQGWAIGTGIGLGALIGLFGAVWLAVGVGGAQQTTWLQFINRFWPLGAFPDPVRREQ